MSTELLIPGREISILVDYATAHCAIGVSTILGRIMHVTDKAVEIRAETESGKPITFWLPRKALTRVSDAKAGSWKYVRADLARWFKPNGRTARAMSLVTSHNSLVG